MTSVGSTPRCPLARQLLGRGTEASGHEDGALDLLEPQPATGPGGGKGPLQGQLLRALKP